MQPDLSKYPSTGDLETDARLALAYEERRQSMAGNRFFNIRCLAPSADLEEALEESESNISKCSFSGDPHPSQMRPQVRNCPHKAKTTIPPALPQLPNMVDEDAVYHHHHHEYVHCTVTHHHHYACTTSPARSYRGEDHDPAAGSGPLTSTRVSPWRALTPFELANPCTCLHRDTRASTRTRSRSRGPASKID
jgi:hypothetical protein